MASPAIAHDSAAPLAVDGTPGLGIMGTLVRFFASMQSATEARRLRAELGALDAHLLRDIGLYDGEIPSVHAGEDNLPLSWRD